MVGDPNLITFYIDNGSIRISVNEILFCILEYTFLENLHGAFSQYAKTNPTKIELNSLI